MKLVELLGCIVDYFANNLELHFDLRLVGEVLEEVEADLQLPPILTLLV